MTRPTKVYFNDKVFLESGGRGRTAYVAGEIVNLTDWLYGEFYFHDGNDTTHLHFDFESRAEMVIEMKKMVRFQEFAMRFTKALIKAQQDSPKIKAARMLRKKATPLEKSEALVRQKDFVLLARAVEKIDQKLRKENETQ